MALRVIHVGTPSRRDDALQYPFDDLQPVAPMNDALIPALANSEEAWTSEGCFIREILNDPRVPEASLAVARVAAGTTTELHRLTVAEWYLIKQGVGRMEVGDAAPFDVAAGDTVAIPAGTAQRITNAADEDLVFECLCIPRFTPDCYEALE